MGPAVRFWGWSPRLVSLVKREMAREVRICGMSSQAFEQLLEEVQSHDNVCRETITEQHRQSQSIFHSHNSSLVITKLDSINQQNSTDIPKPRLKLRPRLDLRLSLSYVDQQVRVGIQLCKVTSHRPWQETLYPQSPRHLQVLLASSSLYQHWQTFTNNRLMMPNFRQPFPRFCSPFPGIHSCRYPIVSCASNVYKQGLESASQLILFTLPLHTSSVRNLQQNNTAGLSRSYIPTIPHRL